MKKIICIGECSLNVVFGADGQPCGSMPGGRIGNAAAILGGEGLPVLMASEAADDAVGQMVVDFLASAGVATDTIDRFTEGRTPLNIFTSGADGLLTLSRYEQYPPQDGFDIVWPRVEEGDIIVFGGYYAIAPRIRQRLSKFLENAVEMKATLVYLPGFLPQQEPRITRVMPVLLENLELAHLVITRNDDLRVIFGIDADDACYNKHINFYCRSLINVNPACGRISYFSGKDVTSAEIPDGSLSGSLLWNAGVLAGVVKALVKAPFGSEGLDAPPESVRESFIREALAQARATEATQTAPWQTCP